MQLPVLAPTVWIGSPECPAAARHATTHDAASSLSGVRVIEADARPTPATSPRSIARLILPQAAAARRSVA